MALEVAAISGSKERFANQKIFSKIELIKRNWKQEGEAGEVVEAEVAEAAEGEVAEGAGCAADLGTEEVAGGVVVVAGPVAVVGADLVAEVVAEVGAVAG